MSQLEVSTDVEMDLECNSLDINQQNNITLTTNVENNKRKRRLSASINAEPSKKFLGDSGHNEAVLIKNNFNILDFSDEMLLEILLHCNSLTLQALAKTCERFENLVKDRRLWKSFDFSKKKLTANEINKLLKYLTKETKEFSVRGLVSKYPNNKWKNNTLTANILSQLSTKCPLLETLAVYEGFLNFQDINISNFPPSLKHLILNACEIARPRSPKVFNKFDYHLQYLEELSLEKCRWFETHDLVVFSKLPHLKRLNLRGCTSLKDCVPYGSIAARFGFKRLEVLDIRDTPISDSDIQCFNITSTLREILMECPEDLRDKRKQETVNRLSDADDKELQIKSLSNRLEKSQSKCDQEQQNVNERKYGDSDVETGSDFSKDGSEDDDNFDEDDKSNKTNNIAAAGSSTQNHFIQVIIHDGNLVNVNNDRIMGEEYRLREINGLRYMVGVVNGGGPEEVLQRALEERQAAQRRNEQILVGQQQQQAEIPIQDQKPQCSNSSNDVTTNAIDDDKPESFRLSVKTSKEDLNLPGPSKLKENIVKEKDKNKEDETEAGPSQNIQFSSNNIKKRNIKLDEKPIQPNENEESLSLPQQNQIPDPLNRVRPDEDQPQQRLIIIHQRRPEEEDLGIYRNRNISLEIHNRRQAFQSFIRQYNQQQQQYPDDILLYNNLISDRGLCSFGMPRHNVQEGIVWIRAELRSADTLIERITVRNYRSITDVTLRHLATCAPNLQYLDVTGTSVTRNGINQFQAAKPNCVLVSHFTEPLQSSS